jgi:Ceramidase
MDRAHIKPNHPVLVLFSLMLISLGGLLLLPPIAQDQSYHQFADERTILGIPNFWNVVSNLPFLVIGAAGIRRHRDDPATVVFFLGVFLTGIGSSYYHWNPNDGTLFWDRLPMTLSFAAILALVVEERVSARAGAILLWPALAIGVFSLLLWRWTDDLRLYFWVQFFPGLAVILAFLFYPPKYTGTRYWIAAGVLYALAKVFEFTDEAVYSAGILLSGHTLKHLAAAAACFAIFRYYQTRQLIRDGQPGRPVLAPSAVSPN